MRTVLISISAGLVVLGCASAQVQPVRAAVPRLIRISNTFHPANGLAPSPVESVTLSVYAEERGGNPLWSEMQNVTVDPDGRYTVLMGSTLPDGVPLEMLAGGAQRWLGVQFNRIGEAERPRILLVSVPYALKAADAETLGGRPASDYLLAAPGKAETLSAPPGMISPEAGGEDQPGRTGEAPPATCCAKSWAHGANGLPLLGAAPHLTASGWVNGNGGSIYYTAGNVGIGTIYPAAALDVYGFGANAWTYLRGNLNGYSTPTVNYGMMVGWNASGGGGETQVLYGTSLGGSPRLDFGRWNGTTKMIDVSLNNGRLGIGTMTPAYSLDVSGTINSTAATDNGPSLSLTNPKKTLPGTANRWAVYNMTGAAGNSLQFWNYDVSGCLPAGLCTSRLTITDAGKVGIGTSTPGWNLDVAGDINFSGTLRYQGAPALQVSGTSGQTAYGYMALQGNTTGTNNTANGYNALAFNTSGRQNTSSGGYALYSNTTGSFNTAYGYGALQSSTTGAYSTAIGYSALGAATGAGYNTAVGGYALATNTIGQDNAAIGYSALRNSTVGTQSTAVGNYSLYTSSTGGSNTALGAYALYFARGSNNIGIGYQAGYFPGANGNTTSNNIHIGSSGTATDNATIRIGTLGTQTSFYAAGVFGTTAGANAVPVYIDSTGHLGTVQSSRRFKEEIRDMGETSRGLMRLRPVTFRYRQPFADGSQPRQYGLIAEEVAEVYPDLVVRSADGRIETVKYQVLDSMLLNEVQRQQKQIESEEARILRLEEEVSRLEALLGASQ